MDATFYTSPAWRDLRARALARDGNRCTVARLLGGTCSGLLHEHHIDPDGDPLDIDNVGTACASHHATWESLRRAIVRARDRREGRIRKCRHKHRYDHARRECAERRARRAAA